jgi:molybdopterin molybdotransferase
MDKSIALGDNTACRAMIDFDAAQAILAAHVRPIGETESVPLAAAAGRRLAAPVVACIDAPRQDCAAMDGYAIRDDDLAAGLRAFRCVATVCAGQKAPAPLWPGETMRVMTGAPVPDGADRVIVVENCSVTGHLVRIGGDAPGKVHIRRQGSDFRRGDLLLEPGRELYPALLVPAAAADVSHVQVARRPHILLVVSGDELVPPGSASTTTDGIPDSLSLAVAALVRQWGGDIDGIIGVGDDPEAMLAACRASDADIIVLLGGASRGDRDFGRSTLSALGGHILFADVAMKPGKPVWYGRTPAAHIFGLPGNPTAAITTARLFLAPLIVGLAGGDPASALAWRLVPNAKPIDANGPREAFLCAQSMFAGIEIIERQEASGQRLIGRTDMLIRRPAHAPALPQSAALLPALSL